ncbi:MAG: hypothetical protein KY468_06320 [Armatimonadetes bacterium]|nr:hypothetical protein [Armatimonadota bacterium]
MATLPEPVIFYGTDNPLPEQKSLRAGQLTLLYENGDLRYIRLGEREVIRRIYVAVRDRNWGTVPPRLSNVRLEEGEDSFRITNDVEHREGDIDFAWKGTITGEPDGTISFTMDGEARSTFLRNRIGFCVLHPIRECAGARVMMEHPGGDREESSLPVLIAPHQPFMDMEAISHEVQPGVWAELRFTGDLFEMEDQRNWTDASYKIYCTPLRLAYPVEIRKGTRVAQSVTLRLTGEAVTEDRVTEEEGVTVTLEEPATPLPRIGLGISSAGEPLSEKEIERLRALNLSHLRVDLRLSEDDLVGTVLCHAWDEARAIGISLEVAVHLTGAKDEIWILNNAFKSCYPHVCRWIIFHEAEKTTSDTWVERANEHIASFSSSPVGSGTDADFVDLNRFRPAVEVSDFIAYPMNPQVHAFDNASLVETLEAQAATVESARVFTDGKPLVISPVTLKRRFNPDATGPEPEPAPGELPRPVDPRQMSLFGAGWTMGSIKRLAQTGGLESVTYYETTGWRGIMETAEGSPLPEKFCSLPGAVFPMYHVFADAGEFAGGEVIRSASSHPLLVESLALRKGDRRCLLLANYTKEEQSVTINGIRGRVCVRTLDARNAEHAMTDPEAFRAMEGEEREPEGEDLRLLLSPYAYIRVDTVKE